MGLVQTVILQRQSKVSFTLFCRFVHELPGKLYVIAADVEAAKVGVLTLSKTGPELLGCVWQSFPA
jgi:hypothetical protein